MELAVSEGLTVFYGVQGFKKRISSRSGLAVSEVDFSVGQKHVDKNLNIKTMS